MATRIPVICYFGIGEIDLVVESYTPAVLIAKFGDAAFDATIADKVPERFDLAAIRAVPVNYFNLGEDTGHFRKTHDRLLGCP